MTDTKNPAAPLVVYRGRKLTSTGKLPLRWIGIVPPEVPGGGHIARAVHEMGDWKRNSLQMVVINRPDDGETPPEKIEAHHITFCAGLKDDAAIDKVEKAIHYAKFTADDLVLTRDKEGRPVYDVFEKGGVLFAIFHYTESKRFRAIRERLVAEFCEPYDDKTKKGYYVKNAHVTVAYGVVRYDRWAILWVALMLLLAALLIVRAIVVHSTRS